MHDSVEDDEAEDVTVTKGPSPHGHLHLVHRRWELPLRFSRRIEYDPGVTPQAAVVPVAVEDPHELSVLRPHFGGVGPHELVAVESAREQVVVDPGAEPASRQCPWRRDPRLAHRGGGADSAGPAHIAGGAVR